jgi:signal transduction histidine kinase
MRILSLPLLRYSALRLALIYVAVAVISVSGLLWSIYLYSQRLMDRETDLVIQAEGATLREEFDDGGVTRLTEILSRRADDWGRIGAVYLLTGSNGEKLAGNLSSWPDSLPGGDQWLEFKLQAREGDAAVEHPARAIHYDLDSSHRLLVGTDIIERTRAGERLRATTLWGIGLTTLLTGLIAWWYTRRVAGRVKAVASTCEAIISGDLAQRLPQTGAQDEFDQLTTAVNHVLDRIEQQTSVVRTTFASAAHDLRTPMQRVRARIDAALQEAGGTTARQDHLSAAVSELDRVQRTLATLLQIANAELGLATHMREAVDLAQLATEIVELYAPLARERQLQLRCAGDATAVLHGNRQLLAQLLVNVLENALRHVPAGGAITVSVERQSAAIELSIRDNGPGIPAALRERSLRPFERSRSEVGGSSGLGLSLVAAVARLHRGELHLEDNQPGLVVRCSFPLPAPVG